MIFVQNQKFKKLWIFPKILIFSEKNDEPASQNGFYLAKITSFYNLRVHRLYLGGILRPKKQFHFPLWVYPINSGFPDCDVSLSVKVVLIKTKDFEHMGRKNEAR